MSEADADRLIRRWAESHAPELIAKAQAEALEIARTRLVDALLEAATARMTAAPRSAPPEPTKPAAPSEPLLWVYGAVTSAAGAPRAPGVDGRPVRVHQHAGVTALVSEVPRERFSEAALKDRLEDLEELEGLARAHEGVLEAAMAVGAVVPFRLCTIYSSADALDAMLDREGLSLTAALDRLEGMQEWGVKAYLRAARAASPAGAPSEAASGTDYLTRKRESREAAVAGREASETVAAEVHARLTERAAAATLSRPQDRRLTGREEEMLLNAAYLVPAQEAHAFREAVEALGRRHEADDVALELTGPWPPYHFVEPPSRDDDA